MRSRLRAWTKATWIQIKKRWVWLLISIPIRFVWGMIYSRILDWANSAVDKNGKSWVAYIPKVMAPFRNPFTVAGIAFLAILLVLILHAYAETRTGVHTAQPSMQAAANDTLNVELTPSNGPGDRMLLAVTNREEKQKFHATCRTVARRYDPNELLLITFDLEWERSPLTREIYLSTGESCNLAIAAAEDDRATGLSKMEILGLSGKQRKCFELSRWDREKVTGLPEYDLEITVFGENGRASGLFTLRSGTSRALEMVLSAQSKTLRERTLRLRDEMQAYLDNAPPPDTYTKTMSEDEILSMSGSARRVEKLHHGYETRFAERIKKIFHEFGERNVMDTQLANAVNPNRQVNNESLYMSVIARLTALAEQPEAQD
jgi:uncharacterized protein YggT (Ycf19 family)